MFNQTHDCSRAPSSFCINRHHDVDLYKTFSRWLWVPVPKGGRRSRPLHDPPYLFVFDAHLFQSPLHYSIKKQAWSGSSASSSLPSPPSPLPSLPPSREPQSESRHCSRRWSARLRIVQAESTRNGRLIHPPSPSPLSPPRRRLLIALEVLKGKGRHFRNRLPPQSQQVLLLVWLWGRVWYVSGGSGMYGGRV
jgi:hypothetical protein